MNIFKADLNNEIHSISVLKLLDDYAKDIMGGGEELPVFVKENLIQELKKRPTASVFLAFVDDAPAGLAICFEGFSTFACKPLINIHGRITYSIFQKI